MKKTKRIAALVLMLVLLLQTAVFAAGNTMVYSREKGYKWADYYLMVAADAATGKILPLCDYTEGMNDEGVLYAYAPEGTKLSFVKPELKEFTDQDVLEGYYDYYSNFLLARGVMVGNTDGTFGYLNPMTRAELVTVLSRLFSLNPETTCSYTDVANNAWYAGFAEAVKKDCGMFAGDKFEPEKEVTNEEVIAFLCAMLQKRNLLDNSLKDDMASYRDFSSVSEPYKEPMQIFVGNHYSISAIWQGEYSEDDPNSEYLLIEPQKTATRGEVSETLGAFIRDFIRNNAPAVPRNAETAFELPKIDGSTSTYPLTEAIYGALFYHGDKYEKFPAQHSKTSKSYEKLINGETDIIFVPDPSEAVKNLAKEKGVELEYIPIANEALVFFTAKNNGVQNITKDQLHEMYVNNTFKDWSELGAPAAPLAAVCRNNDSGSHAQMEKFILDGKEINETIQKERTSVMMASILSDVARFNNENPGSYAIGYSLYYYFNTAAMVLGVENDLKMIPINGVAPTEESIASGAYPFTTSYYAVVRTDSPEGSPARNLIKWLETDEGKNAIENAGFGAIR